MAKVDLDAVLKLQKDYDALQADCKAFFGIIVNLAFGKGEPLTIEFNNPDKTYYLTSAMDLIREHATWNKSQNQSQ